MASATVRQFKRLIPESDTPMSSGKVPITLKLENFWDDKTLYDLTKLVHSFGRHLHLSKVVPGCIAVIWLCSVSEVEQLKIAISEVTDSLLTMGVLQVFIGEEELVLERTHSATGKYTVCVRVWVPWCFNCSALV